MSEFSSTPDNRCHTSPLRASGIPSRTRPLSCLGLCLVDFQRFNTSPHVSNTSSEQSFETSPVPLSRGSSPSKKSLVPNNVSIKNPHYLPEWYSSLGVKVSMDVMLGDCIRLDKLRLRFSKFLSSSPDVSMLSTS